MFRFTTLPPLALYVHLPWCVRKCPYCDFNSYSLDGAIPEQDYVAALLRDLDYELVHAQGRVIQTVFLGGGTPSLFSPASIARLLAGIRARVPLAPGAEITLEANPGIAEQARLRGYREAGVNRLSLGIQSFEDEKLKTLGRIHSRAEALRAAEAARAAGFENFNLDLMFGLPGQTRAQARADLEQALAFAPPHLSVYQLTIEPHTRFHAHPPPALPDEDTIGEMLEQREAMLERAGLQQYEVSAFARSGFECRHNLNYWTFGDYLGIGAGAHGKLTDATGIARYWKIKQPRRYLATAGTPAAVGGARRLAPEDAAFEFMLNALRLREGFPAALFTERTGIPLARLAAPLRGAQRKGWLEHAADTIRATPRGYRFLDDLLESFLPATASA